jgi:radical SAM superfamily enzyme YgiQ (UPF0313 family)
MANLQRSGIDAEILELEDQFPVEAVEFLTKKKPKIVCFSVHIWNIELIRKCAALLRQVRPSVFIIAGGPELEAIPMDDSLVGDVDYIVKGEGDAVIAPLCSYCLSIYEDSSLLPHGGDSTIDRGDSRIDGSERKYGCFKSAPIEGVLSKVAAVEGKIIRAFLPDLSSVPLPYHLYDEEDIENRVVYVETSRGCPFACHYCASSLEKGVRVFPLDIIFLEFDKLLKRGVHHFKFVDRSFNSDPHRAADILRFFLEHDSSDFYLHFEFLPVLLPDFLQELLSRFPEGTLHIEVGIQTFNREVSRRVGRAMSAAVAEDTLSFLLNETKGIVHGDLIIGLPGDTIESIAQSFNRLWRLGVQEIQVNLLKCLKGTPLEKHSLEFSMKYSPYPPYEVLSTSTMDFLTIRRLHEYSRIFNQLCHSDNFPRVSQIIMAGGEKKSNSDDSQPFGELEAFSNYVLKEFGRSHHISLRILIRSVFDYLVLNLNLDSAAAAELIALDYYDGGRRKRVPWLEELRHPVKV